MKHTFFLALLLPFFSFAQDGQPKPSSVKRQFPRFEISARYGASLPYVSPPPARIVVSDHSAASPYGWGKPMSGVVTPKLSLAASVFVSRSVDIGLFYSRNTVRYSCVGPTRSFNGNFVDPATRIGFFGRYHYSLKKWKPYVGLGVADLSAQKWCGLSWTASLGVDYTIVRNLSANLQAEVVRDAYNTARYGLTDNIVFGNSVLGGISFRF